MLRVMQIRAKVTRQVSVWLSTQSVATRESFFKALLEVCADELTLLGQTEPLHLSDDPHIHRVFMFGDKYKAAFKWFQIDRAIHVTKCALRDGPWLPPPAA